MVVSLLCIKNNLYSYSKMLIVVILALEGKVLELHTLFQNILVQFQT
jgi:hypothetical protein